MARRGDAANGSYSLLGKGGHRLCPCNGRPDKSGCSKPVHPSGMLLFLFLFLLVIEFLASQMTGPRFRLAYQRAEWLRVAYGQAIWPDARWWRLRSAYVFDHGQPSVRLLARIARHYTRRRLWRLLLRQPALQHAWRRFWWRFWWRLLPPPPALCGHRKTPWPGQCILERSYLS